MRALLRRFGGYVVAGVVGSALTAGGPAIAATVANYATNADKVDGRHAVGARTSVADRAGRLVATNSAGRLPNNIIRKARDANKLDGVDSTGFLSASAKAVDADKLDGINSTGFLSASAKAVDADKLDGINSTDFLRSTAKAADADTLDGADSTAFATAAALTAAVARIEQLEALLADVTRSEVHGEDTLRLSGMNLQIVDGSGDTGGTPNGEGNVIIGYNTARSSGSDKSGSHYLVIGDRHNYTTYGGIVAGLQNTANNEQTSVLGGASNTASGRYALVAGGMHNAASGLTAVILGGGNNKAEGTESSVSGGMNNMASGDAASVSGGTGNTASGRLASVSGGSSNTASGVASSVLGGDTRTVSTSYACHPACS